MDKCCGVHFLTGPPGNASVSNSESIAANRNAREFFSHDVGFARPPVECCGL